MMVGRKTKVANCDLVPSGLLNELFLVRQFTLFRKPLQTHGSSILLIFFSDVGGGIVFQANKIKTV